MLKKLNTKPKAHHPDPPIGVKALALGVEMQALKEIEHESNEQLRQKCIWFMQWNVSNRILNHERMDHDV